MYAQDCGWGNLLAHGPQPGQVSAIPSIAAEAAGKTWDGGPAASIPLLPFDESRPVLTTVQGNAQDSRRCMQTPQLEMSDEAALAVTSVQDRIFDSSVEQVVNAWHTFGPLAPSGGATPLMNTTLRFRLFDQAITGVPANAYPGTGVSAGHMASIFRSEMSFKRDLEIEELIVLSHSGGPSVPECFIVVGNSYVSTTNPVVTAMSQMPQNSPGVQPFQAHVPQGGWFTAFAGSNLTAQASVYFNRGLPIDLNIRVGPPQLKGSQYTVTAANNVSAVRAGQELVFELAQLGTDLRTAVNSVADVQAIVKYLAEPTGLRIQSGVRLSGPATAGLLEVSPDSDSYVAEIVSAPRIMYGIATYIFYIPNSTHKCYVYIDWSR